MTQNRKPLVGLIPAAGKGVRARPYTDETHKGMLSINGVPNIERIIISMRDNLQIREIVIVVGYLGHTISEYFGDGERLGVILHYVENTELDKGWAWSIFLARGLITQHFCVMLCDECQIDTNHSELRDIDYENELVVCTSQRVDDPLLIKKNFAIEHNGAQVSKLIENPETTSNNLMGTCTFLMSCRIFDYLEEEFIGKGVKSVEFIDYLNVLIQAGKSVKMFELDGTCININDRDSLALARYTDRAANFPNYSRALLVHANGDEQKIDFTLRRYYELQLFDEIVLLLPGSNTCGPIAELDNVTTVICPDSLKGIGERISYGLQQLNHDILVVTEADYLYPARDVEKLLLYLKEADIIVGSRTSRLLNEEGTDMRGFLRIFHTFIGNIMELLWWRGESRFSDAGCSFRALWKTSRDVIAPHMKENGPEAMEEMLTIALEQHLRVIEIPVSYSIKRKSSESGDLSFKKAASRLAYIIKRRLRS